jgi:hypothetical protein
MTMVNLKMLQLEIICLKTYYLLCIIIFVQNMDILVIVTKEHCDSSWLGVLYKVAVLTGPALGNVPFFVPEVRYKGIAQCQIWLGLVQYSNNFWKRLQLEKLSLTIFFVVITS